MITMIFMSFSLSLNFKEYTPKLIAFLYTSVNKKLIIFKKWMQKLITYIFVMNVT